MTAMLWCMARLPRFDLPGIPQHVAQRGNNRLPCFLGDDDRQHYLQCLLTVPERFGCRLHAYVLMDNHVHQEKGTEAITQKSVDMGTNVGLKALCDDGFVFSNYWFMCKSRANEGTSPNGSFSLSWTAATGASSYTLSRSGTSVYSGSGTSWSASGFSDGTYSYTVDACNASGCSAASNTVSVAVL